MVGQAMADLPLQELTEPRRREPPSTLIKGYKDARPDLLTISYYCFSFRQIKVKFRILTNIIHKTEFTPENILKQNHFNSLINIYLLYIELQSDLY